MAKTPIIAKVTTDWQPFPSPGEVPVIEETVVEETVVEEPVVEEPVSE
jgi:hypothetical protein